MRIGILAHCLGEPLHLGLIENALARRILAKLLDPTGRVATQMATRNSLFQARPRRAEPAVRGDVTALLGDGKPRFLKVASGELVNHPVAEQL